jgi:GT2 family glycosyltransferase
MNLTEHSTTTPGEQSDQLVSSSLDQIRVKPRHTRDGKLFRRGGDRLRLRGVTYGPFKPDGEADPFPTRGQVDDDFAAMGEAGVNSIRTYHVPPSWLLDRADAHGLSVMVDVPWPKHLCFLADARLRAQARTAVRRAAERGRDHPSLFAYSVGNEIPPDIVRWHGARRVERFIAELCDVARQADPDCLVTYANFPPTEYLDLSCLDFATFNVYLHERETFRRYLLRLQNLVGELPLVLGELGMDTIRHGELAQAEFLAGHLREAMLAGLAGAFVFSWTDDWFTGGHPIEDWAFGVTGRDRSPKAACHALREVFEASTGGLAPLLTVAPRVSVVLCSYNGGRTLAQCLASLRHLDYPDYEVILVDDGSADDTREIAALFPEVRTIHQVNKGLSEARNVGLRAARGSVIAYTDSDCVADPDWLTLLVHQLVRSGAAAVGGPNLSPDDGRLAACVAVSPGQPTHVLESDQVAEHIPGCNMAFRREALEAVNGFDPVYREAGDDVDVCWRLQQSGMWITFAPGAFVWHHRRQNPRAYFKQQAGYGEAEALLRFKHPDRFNGRGEGKWRGMLYGVSLRGLRIGGPIIYRGTFGSGLFQCVYQPGPAHWAMLPSTLEWQTAAVVLAMLSAAGTLPVAWVAALMLILSALVAVLQALQAKLPSGHEGWRNRLLVSCLCYAQPLVRSWARYRTRLAAHRDLRARADSDAVGPRLPFWGPLERAYWDSEWRNRSELLDRGANVLTACRWGKVVESGRSDWDLEFSRDPWTVVRVATAQEDHGSGRRLIRVRFVLRPDRLASVELALAALATALAATAGAWPAVAGSLALAAVGFGCWWQGAWRASAVVNAFDRAASTMGLIRVEEPRKSDGDRSGRHRSDRS